MRRLKPTAIATTAAAILFASAPPPPAGAEVIGVPPARTITLGQAPEALALATDGTTFMLVEDGEQAGKWNVDVLGPAATNTGAAKAITGFGESDLDVDGTHGLAATDASGAVVVVDPDQPAGALVPVRRITGPNTRIDGVVSLAWASDGSLWVSDTDAAGAGELLLFAPGADGDVAPVRVITGPRTGLDEPAGYDIDALPGGGVVAGYTPAGTTLRVFDGSADGDVPPARRIRVEFPSPNSFLFGIAADALGRIYVTTGDIDGAAWGHVLVFGADGREAPALDLTGTTSQLHVPVYPSVAPDGDMAVVDAVFLNGEPALTRVLVFDALPAPEPEPSRPSAPRRLRATPSGARLAVSWRQPADDGGAPVSGYRVEVVHRGRIVYRTSAGSDSRRVTVRRERLPTGRLAIRVSARNSVGKGEVATTAVRNR